LDSFLQSGNAKKGKRGIQKLAERKTNSLLFTDETSDLSIDQPMDKQAYQAGKYYATLSWSFERPLRNLRGNLFRITEKTSDNKIQIIQDSKFYRQLDKWWENGIDLINMSKDNMRLVATPSGITIEFLESLSLDESIRIEQLMQNASISSYFDQNNLRKAISWKSRKLAQGKVEYIKKSGIVLESLLGQEWDSKNNDYNGKFLVGRRYLTTIWEVVEAGIPIVIGRVRTRTQLKDLPLWKLMQLKRFVETIENGNPNDKIIFECLLDNRTYLPIAVNKGSLNLVQDPTTGLKWDEKLLQDFKDKTDLIRQCSSDKWVFDLTPFYVTGNRTREPVLKVSESMLRPIITTQNTQFYENLDRTNYEGIVDEWRDAVNTENILYYHGLALDQYIQLLNSLDLTFFSRKINLQPIANFDMIFSAGIDSFLIPRKIPEPTVLRRDMNNDIIRVPLSGKSYSELVDSSMRPYKPVDLNKGFVIITIPEFKSAAHSVKNILINSSIANSLFGKKSIPIDIRAEIADYTGDAYISALKKYKAYDGVYSIIQDKELDKTSSFIYSSLKYAAATESIPLQNLIGRNQYRYFDHNLLYSMLGKMGGSYIGVDTTDICQTPFVITCRDVSKGNNQDYYGAFISSYGADLVTGYIKGERAELKGETIENLDEILHNTEREIWTNQRLFDQPPELIINIRDGFTPEREKQLEREFYVSRGYSYISIDLLKDAGCKVLRQGSDVTTVAPTLTMFGVILDQTTAIVQPHKITSSAFLPSPYKIRIAEKHGSKAKGLDIWRLTKLLGYGSYIAQTTPRIEYAKYPDFINQAHKAANLYRINALPTNNIFNANIVS